LFEQYRESFYEKKDPTSRVAAAYRNARSGISSVLRQLGRELDQIFGVSEISKGTDDSVDPEQVISRLQVQKALIAFEWMLASHFEQTLDADAETWKFEGPEFVLRTDLVESIVRIRMQRRKPEKAAEIDSVIPEAEQ
jgi:hypothetical protein